MSSRYPYNGQRYYNKNPTGYSNNPRVLNRTPIQNKPHSKSPRDIDPDLYKFYKVPVDNVIGWYKQKYPTGLIIPENNREIEEKNSIEYSIWNPQWPAVPRDVFLTLGIRYLALPALNMFLDFMSHSDFSSYSNYEYHHQQVSPNQISVFLWNTGSATILSVVWAFQYWINTSYDFDTSYVSYKTKVDKNQALGYIGIPKIYAPEGSKHTIIDVIPGDFQLKELLLENLGTHQVPTQTGAQYSVEFPGLYIGFSGDTHSSTKEDNQILLEIPKEEFILQVTSMGAPHADGSPYAETFYKCWRFAINSALTQNIPFPQLST